MSLAHATVGAMRGRTARSGARGERTAARHLRRRGWRVLARNWRGAGGELDLVVARGDVVAMVEVKTRADPGARAEPVTAAQRARIARAAAAFLAARPALVERAIRFDVIVVGAGWPPPVRHIAAAWEPA